MFVILGACYDRGGNASVWRVSGGGSGSSIYNESSALERVGKQILKYLSRSPRMYNITGALGGDFPGTIGGVIKHGDSAARPPSVNPP